MLIKHSPKTEHMNQAFLIQASGVYDSRTERRCTVWTCQAPIVPISIGWTNQRNEADFSDSSSNCIWHQRSNSVLQKPNGLAMGWKFFLLCLWWECTLCTAYVHPGIQFCDIILPTIPKTIRGGKAAFKVHICMPRWWGGADTLFGQDTLKTVCRTLSKDVKQRSHYSTSVIPHEGLLFWNQIWLEELKHISQQWWDMDKRCTATHHPQ